MAYLNLVIVAFLCCQNQILHKRSNAAVSYLNAEIVEFVAEYILELHGNYVQYAVTKESLHGITGILIIMFKCVQFHGD